MNDANLLFNNSIQYCMTLAVYLLDSLRYKGVTNAGVSEDDFPTNTSLWMIGYSGLFMSALNIQPFFDVFWTTSIQTDNAYKSTSHDCESFVMFNLNTTTTATNRIWQTFTAISSSNDSMSSSDSISIVLAIDYTRSGGFTLMIYMLFQMIVINLLYLHLIQAIKVVLIKVHGVMNYFVFIMLERMAKKHEDWVCCIILYQLN